MEGEDEAGHTAKEKKIKDKKNMSYAKQLRMTIIASLLVIYL